MDHNYVRVRTLPTAQGNKYIRACVRKNKSKSNSKNIINKLTPSSNKVVVENFHLVFHRHSNPVFQYLCAVLDEQ